jgi:hypothetical protein
MHDLLPAHQFKAFTQEIDLGLGSAPLGIVFSHNQLCTDKVWMQTLLKQVFADGEHGNCSPGAKKKKDHGRNQSHKRAKGFATTEKTCYKKKL